MPRDRRRRRYPLSVTLTGGNRHDSTELLPLVHADYDHHRAGLRRLGITPHRGQEHASRLGLGATRWVVKGTIRLATPFQTLRIRH
jgi:hypothetical protein